MVASNRSQQDQAGKTQVSRTDSQGTIRIQEVPNSHKEEPSHIKHGEPSEYRRVRCSQIPLRGTEGIQEGPLSTGSAPNSSQGNRGNTGGSVLSTWDTGQFGSGAFTIPTPNCGHRPWQVPTGDQLLIPQYLLHAGTQYWGSTTPLRPCTPCSGLEYLQNCVHRKAGEDWVTMNIRLPRRTQC